MNDLPELCPVCGENLTVSNLVCPTCDTRVEGEFFAGAGPDQGEFTADQLYRLLPFARLSPDQLYLMVAFVRCEGRLNRMAEELGLSYPTLRSRLDEVLKLMGYEPVPGDEGWDKFLPDPEERQHILDQLNMGEINFDQAKRLLRGEWA
jgi:hypothetical protein